jgi:VWFA-related protein
MKLSAPTIRRGVSRVRSLLVFASLFVVTAVTLKGQESAVRVETFSMKQNGEVSIENARGNTRVESWDYQTVRVVAEKKSNSGAAIEPGELVLMGAQGSVIVQCKPGSGKIDLTLYVPNTARLQLNGGGFPVDISGPFAGAIIDTTSGSISYRLPSNDDARVTMRSASGTVRSTVALSDIEKNGTRSLRGQLGSGAAPIDLNSHSGIVTLTPGPAASIARAQKADPAGNTQVARGNTPNDSNSDGDVRNDRNDQRGGPQTRRDTVQHSDVDSNDRLSTRQAAGSNGSMVFAGSDRSDDSSSTTTSGPFNRPRSERRTNSGDSGLKARIIPSNEPQRGASNPAGSVFDQSDDDSQKSNSSANSKGGGSTRQATPNSNYSGNGSIDFAGSDRSDDGSSKSKVGPMERERQSRTSGGGGSGLRVRIIPATAPPAPSRDSNTVFDQRDDNDQASSTPRGNASQDNVARQQGGRIDDQTRQSSAARRDDPVFRQEPDEIVSNNPRSGAAPVLHRGRSDEQPATDNEPAPKAVNSDEEAIVLKAALVSLNVSVTNRSGMALANLKKEDFEVAENSEPQKIEFFQPTTAPFNLVLALDLSGSIKDKLDVVKSAALRFVDILGPQDKVAVVTFTDEIRVVSQLTGDREELKRRIKSVDRSQGGTAFYEALWFSLMDTLRGTKGQRNAIVVMTDGVDSSLDRFSPMQSRVSFNQLSRRLEESDVLVFPIYVDTEYEEVFERGNSSSEAYAIARDQLEKIAEVSGGQMFKAEKFGDLAGVYKQVAAAIRTVYSVGYYPTNAEKDGTFRRVRVGVNRADAAVRTRKGYYAK